MNNKQNNVEIIEAFDNFIINELQKLNESKYNWEAITLGLGIVASTINEDNGNEIVYDYFTENEINESINFLNENIDNLEDEQLDYCFECFKEYLNELAAAGGGIAGGFGVNKLLQKSQDKKIAALRDSGASEDEITKMQKKQGRMRKLATLGGVIGGAYAGSKIKGGIRNYQQNKKNEKDPVFLAKQDTQNKKNQFNINKQIEAEKKKQKKYESYYYSDADFVNEDYDWEAIALGLGIVASTINEDNGNEIVYDYFTENEINECIDAIDTFIDELDEEQLAYCVKCFNEYLNEEINIVDVAPEKRRKHVEKEDEKEVRRNAINAKFQPHLERNRVNYK